MLNVWMVILSGRILSSFNNGENIVGFLGGQGESRRGTIECDKLSGNMVRKKE